MELGLSGRTAIVTGASRGIGRACSRSLLGEGVNLCAVARDHDLLRSLVDESGAPERCLTVSADLATRAGCETAVAACLAEFGTVDILVNCAGAAQQADVLDVERAVIDDGLALKFHGYLTMSQLVAPGMSQRWWGRIVNIAGAAGTSPTAVNLPTSIANAAVLNMTRSLSDALAQFGVLVNAVCPGATRTDRARRLKLAEAAATGRDVDELLDEAAAAYPARRMAEPDEIARVVTFLASDACSYLFASALYMDGGVRRATP